MPAGTKYVAFRHFNCTDFFWINVDDIEIKANAKRSELLNENFEGDDIPAGWTALDADGDGNNWGVQLNQFTRGEREALAPLRASNVAISYSSLNQGGGYLPLTPNNFLITPKVEGAKKISYKVGSPGNQSWSHDHYALCISKTGTAASDFEIIFEETMVYSQGGANFTREKDLPDGTKYVAFRHYNCTDVLAIVIDDVVITGDGGSSADYTYTVYRDGTKIKEGLTATTFEEEGVAAGNHEYCVEVKYQAGVSPKECVDVTVDPQQFNPVQNLTGSADGQKVTLKWDAPNGTNPNPNPNPNPSLSESFENGIPSSWKTIDADGDGNNWTTTPPPGGSSFSGHNGGSCVSSASYINYQGAQTPDNYLVTPELSLANGGTLT
ncbi:choice-of-anchor J domain-containing protein, partial [Porphyromonas gulae]|uniref:choice-of-anchor J domain-containing protein n=2 Tax=Porphyromonas gulae TaxID=111105 RepID=UPI0029350541